MTVLVNEQKFDTQGCCVKKFHLFVKLNFIAHIPFTGKKNIAKSPKFTETVPSFESVQFSPHRICF